MLLIIICAFVIFGSGIPVGIIIEKYRYYQINNWNPQLSEGELQKIQRDDDAIRDQ